MAPIVKFLRASFHAPSKASSSPDITASAKREFNPAATSEAPSSPADLKNEAIAFWIGFLPSPATLPSPKNSLFVTNSEASSPAPDHNAFPNNWFSLSSCSPSLNLSSNLPPADDAPNKANPPYPVNAAATLGSALATSPAKASTPSEIFPSANSCS